MEGMFTNWQWIIILAICVIAYILAPSDNSTTDFRNYDCYDKSVYKRGKCRKKCKRHYIAKEAEKLEKDTEEIDG